MHYGLEVVVCTAGRMESVKMTTVIIIAAAVTASQTETIRSPVDLFPDGPTICTAADEAVRSENTLGEENTGMRRSIEHKSADLCVRGRYDSDSGKCMYRPVNCSDGHTKTGEREVEMLPDGTMCNPTGQHTHYFCFEGQRIGKEEGTERLERKRNLRDAGRRMFRSCVYVVMGIPVVAFIFVTVDLLLTHTTKHVGPPNYDAHFKKYDLFYCGLATSVSLAIAVYNA